MTDRRALITKEISLVEEELARLGRKNPENAGDWEATVEEGAHDDASEWEGRAVEFTTFAERAELEGELERRWNTLKDALTRFDTDAYGVCTICGSLIEDARLDANPAALTCIAHREQE